ncbi:hypothetical protein PG997_008929 [Apiospora hydei]|uniref:Uncharacterized protein n=1 Tax=Apiospora hydei TaxID=1337664 RepID=A0ABR1WF17_9PEZI
MDGNSKQQHDSPQPNQYAPTPPLHFRHTQIQSELKGLQQAAAPQGLPGNCIDTSPKENQHIEQRAVASECPGCGAILLLKRSANKPSHLAGGGVAQYDGVSRPNQQCNACRLVNNSHRQRRSFSSPAGMEPGTTNEKFKFEDTDANDEKGIEEGGEEEMPVSLRKKSNSSSSPRTVIGKTKEFKFADTDVDNEEPPLAGATQGGGAKTPIASLPVANPDPGIVAVVTTYKEKEEASKLMTSPSAEALATETAREPVHIPLHLRGGGGQQSHSRPNTTAANTTAASTSSSSSATTSTPSNAEDEAWWNIPYKSTMPIPKSFFQAARQYLLGIRTADQLAQNHGVPINFFAPALEHGVVVFVGLAIPGLQPVLRSEEAKNTGRATVPKAAESFFLERVVAENPGFAVLVRDQGMRGRFMEGLGQYTQTVRF